MMRAGRKLTSVEINAVVYRSDLKKGNILQPENRKNLIYNEPFGRKDSVPFCNMHNINAGDYT